MHDMTVCTFRWDCSLENVNANSPDCEKDKNCKTWNCEKLQRVDGGSKTPYFYYHKIFTLKLFLMLQGWTKDTLTMANEYSETTQAGINRTIQWKQMRHIGRCYLFIIIYLFIHLEPSIFRQSYNFLFYVLITLVHDFVVMYRIARKYNHQHHLFVIIQYRSKLTENKSEIPKRRG